jgi:hypothetical protein
MKTNLLICGALLLLNVVVAAPLTESTFTEIIREANTLNPAGNATAAKLNDVLKSPDRVRTGPESRAELTAADNTITRVGANTVFSFSDSGRTLNLEQGNLLFHSPKGNGGGTIKSGGVSAAVLGTTLIVSATVDGGFKVILLEGSGLVTLANGKTVKLKAGQLVFIAPGGTEFSSVMNINLKKLVAGSLLVNGFAHPLPSAPLIEDAVKKQNSLIASGAARETGGTAENGLGSVDHSAYQTAARPPLSFVQYGVIANSGVVSFGAGGRNISTLSFQP